MDDGVIRTRERVQAILWGVHSLSNDRGWLDGKRGEPYSTREIAAHIGVDAHSLESCLRLAGELGWLDNAPDGHGYHEAGHRRWLNVAPLGASVLAEWDEALRAKVTERRLNRKGAPSSGVPPNAGVQSDGAAKQSDGAAIEYERRATPQVLKKEDVLIDASVAKERDVSSDVIVTQGVNGSHPGVAVTPVEISFNGTADAARNGGPSTTDDSPVTTLGEQVVFNDWSPEDKALWKAARKAMPKPLREVFDDGHVNCPDRRARYVAMDFHYPKPFGLAKERLPEIDAWMDSWAPGWVEGWHLRWQNNPGTVRKRGELASVNRARRKS